VLAEVIRAEPSRTVATAILIFREPRSGETVDRLANEQGKDIILVRVVTSNDA
jgi:hypothetical protein